MICDIYVVICDNMSYCATMWWFLMVVGGSEGGFVRQLLVLYATVAWFSKVGRVPKVVLCDCCMVLLGFQGPENCSVRQLLGFARFCLCLLLFDWKSAPLARVAKVGAKGSSVAKATGAEVAQEARRGPKVSDTCP